MKAPSDFFSKQLENLACDSHNSLCLPLWGANCWQGVRLKMPRLGLNGWDLLSELKVDTVAPQGQLCVLDPCCRRRGQGSRSRAVRVFGQLLFCKLLCCTQWWSRYATCVRNYRATRFPIFASRATSRPLISECSWPLKWPCA